MTTSNDQHSQEMGTWERIKQLQRIRERNERREQQQEENHWNFLAGALVAQYLKADLDIPVYKGKDAKEKNAAAFAPLENILSYLATHKEFTAQIAAGARDPPVPPDP